MFCVIIILAIITAEVNHLLKEVVEEWSIFWYMAHNMKGWGKLSDMLVRVIICDEGNDGDDFIEEEEGVEGGGISKRDH